MCLATDICTLLATDGGTSNDSQVTCVYELISQTQDFLTGMLSTINYSPSGMISIDLQVYMEHFQL